MHRRLSLTAPSACGHCERQGAYKNIEWDKWRGNNEDSTTGSYCASHVDPVRDTHYDCLLKVKYDHWIWVSLGQPCLKRVLEEERLGGAASCLDFACGTGRVTEVVAEVFGDTTGLDISQDMLQVARIRLPGIPFVQGNITADAHLIERKFDCVTVFRFFLNAEPRLRSAVLAWIAGRVKKGALVGNIHMNPWSISGFVSLAAIKFSGRKVRVMFRREMECLLLD